MDIFVDHIYVNHIETDKKSRRYQSGCFPKWIFRFCGKARVLSRHILNGSFQRSYGAWTEQTMPFRGVFTKTYNTIRYQAFRLGSRPIGNNGSIFEAAYLFPAGHYDGVGIFQSGQPQRRVQIHKRYVYCVRKRCCKLSVYYEPAVLVFPDRGHFLFNAASENQSIGTK